MRQHDPFATALRQKLDRESCRLCKSLVSDEAWRATLTLAGLPLGSDAGMRTCACCLRQQQEANRQAAEDRAREDEKRRQRPPPIGLRVVNSDAGPPLSPVWGADALPRKGAMRGVPAYL
jgi:hypothetical protein